MILLQNKYNFIGNNSTCHYSSATYQLSSTFHLTRAANQILRKEFNIFYTEFDNCNEPDKSECTTEGPISELFRAARVSQVNNNYTSSLLGSVKFIIRESPTFPTRNSQASMRTQHTRPLNSKMTASVLPRGVSICNSYFSLKVVSQWHQRVITNN